MLDREFRLDDAGWRAWFKATGHDDLNLLLFAVWDPIRVNDSAIVAYEYDHYASDVVRYVQQDDPDGLTRYLLDVEQGAMGLSTRTATTEISRRIIAGAYASAWIWSGRPLTGD